MALIDYGMTLSYNEMDNSEENINYGNDIIAYDNGRENITYDVHTNTSEDNYCLLTSSSPEYEKLNHTKDPLSSESKQYNRKSNLNGDSEGSIHSTPVRRNRKLQRKRQTKLIRKNDSNKRTRSSQKIYGKNKIRSKSRKSASKTKISRTHNSVSAFFSDDKAIPLLDSADESNLRIPALTLPKLKKNSNSIKAKAETLEPLKLTHAKKPTRTSTLLAMMAEAVSAPQYASFQTSIPPSASDYLEYPARSSWPLLREMISKPPISVVSISSAPRQTLSTVLVDPVNSEEPKTNVTSSKLEKEIKCECKFNQGQPCWLLFQEDRLQKERLHHLTLKRESLDLVILAKIAANINREEKTKKYRGRDRQRCRVCYYHEGRQICRETFMFIHGICKGRLCALMQHYKKKGLSVRVHGNKSNVPHHALSYSDSERVLEFIREYANNHCISSFGRKPGSKAGGGLLIMSPTQSKLYVHHNYKVWCSKNKHRAVSLRSFQNLWTKHLPYIVVLRGSNKNPVPVPGSQESVLDLHEDLVLEDELIPARTTSDKSLLVINKSRSINNAQNGSKSNQITSHKHVDCGTNTHLDFDSVTGERKKRNRKGVPPRKTKTSTDLPAISADKDFGNSQSFSDPHLVHTSLTSIHNSINNTRSVNISNSHTNILQNLQPQSNLDSSIFSNDIHIPQSTSTSTLQNHPTTGMNFHNRSTAAVPVMLTSNKDMVYTYNNKTLVSTTKTSNLHSHLYLEQPTQLLDSYTIQCSDRFPAPISGSNGFSDQSQPVLLHHQSSDFSNVHQFDWQTWQSYNA